ncbi:ImcF-related family protein [Pantoea ananatis]
MKVFPGLFTPDGYWNHVDKQIAPVTDALYKDDIWVLGARRPMKTANKPTLAVRQLYIQDYIRQWEQFLSDIQLNSSADLTQRINTARLLSGNHSPCCGS